MNEASTKIKQQVVDKIKAATNILVTVSKDPSIDDLSAALGLTALLNKIDKHATAIFSGTIPSVITFLNPDKVFENTADSLRDFIISLDKEKADHLRYKIEGDFVKIFITPYKTNINEGDLEFSQGDYNVDLVLALGVANQEHLDVALAANGQILDDVTIITLSAGEQASQLGSLDWRDETVGCLCEMIAGLGDSLKADKTLLDKQISTALLTGIVAATDRFSNEHTSSQVMSTAAKLMAAGADQQLIAAKLQESHEITSLPSSALRAGASQSAKDIPLAEPEIAPVASVGSDGSLAISHDIAEPTDNVAAMDSTLPEPIDQPEPVAAAEKVPTIQELISHDVVSAIPDTEAEPEFGGTLNATADQAADDARRELEEQQNKTILSHSYLSGSDADQMPAINGSALKDDEMKPVDIFSGPSLTSTLPPEDATVIPAPTPITAPAVDLPLPPPLPDFSTLAPPAALPDFNTPLGATPPETSTLPPAPTTNDPSQFKIPGQN